MLTRIDNPGADEGADYNIVFRLTPELCTCSNTVINDETTKTVGYVSLNNYYNICDSPTLSEWIARTSPRRSRDGLLMCFTIAQIPTAYASKWNTAGRLASVRRLSSTCHSPPKAS